MDAAEFDQLFLKYFPLHREQLAQARETRIEQAQREGWTQEEFLRNGMVEIVSEIVHWEIFSPELRRVVPDPEVLDAVGGFVEEIIVCGEAAAAHAVHTWLEEPITQERLLMEGSLGPVTRQIFFGPGQRRPARRVEPTPEVEVAEFDQLFVRYFPQYQRMMLEVRENGREEARKRRLTEREFLRFSMVDITWLIVGRQILGRELERETPDPAVLTAVGEFLEWILASGDDRLVHDVSRCMRTQVLAKRDRLEGFLGPKTWESFFTHE
jgi:hypothetical protein